MFEPQSESSFDSAFHIWWINIYHIYSPFKPSIYLLVMSTLVMSARPHVAFGKSSFLFEFSNLPRFIFELNTLILGEVVLIG